MASSNASTSRTNWAWSASHSSYFLRRSSSISSACAVFKRLMYPTSSPSNIRFLDSSNHSSCVDASLSAVTSTFSTSSLTAWWMKVSVLMVGRGLKFARRFNSPKFFRCCLYFFWRRTYEQSSSQSNLFWMTSLSKAFIFIYVDNNMSSIGSDVKVGKLTVSQYRFSV